MTNPRIQDISHPVVVMMAEHYGTLGVVRSLGRSGIRVYAVDPNATAPAFASRYCSGAFVRDLETMPVSASLEMLHSISNELGARPLLIPTTDESALFVAEHAQTLAQWFIFSDQNAGLVKALCNKQEMYHLAQLSGVPVPMSFSPKTREEVNEIAEKATFPLALKAVGGGSLGNRTDKRIVLVRDKDGLLRQFEALDGLRSRSVMIQEYIPGPEEASWMFNGYFDRHSQCLVSFTGRKLRQNPVYSGMTSLGVCCANRKLAEKAQAFLKRLKYRGAVDIDFRYDWRDERYKILDVNPRVGASFRLFVDQEGVDVVRAMYLDLTGQPVPRNKPREGRKWFVEDKDVRSSILYLRDGKLSVGEWWKSLHGIEEAGYFLIGDQRPFWRMCWNHCRRKFERWSALLLRRRMTKTLRVRALRTGTHGRPSEVGYTRSTDHTASPVKENYEQVK